MERRECRSISDPDCLDYPTGGNGTNLRSVVRVTGRRETTAVATVHPRYYISSLEAPAGRLHGGGPQTTGAIENSLHWSLDVTFGEDQYRVRKSLPP